MGILLEPRLSNSVCQPLNFCTAVHYDTRTRHPWGTPMPQYVLVQLSSVQRVTHEIWDAVQDMRCIHARQTIYGTSRAMRDAWYVVSDVWCLTFDVALTRSMPCAIDGILPLRVARRGTRQVAAASRDAGGRAGRAVMLCYVMLCYSIIVL